MASQAAQRRIARGERLAAGARAAAERPASPGPLRQGSQRVATPRAASRPAAPPAEPTPARPVVPRGTLGGLSNPQRVLFATWAIAVGLRVFSDVRSTHDWPCPGPLLKISALYLMLGLASEVAPNLAAWFGVGFLVAYATRVGGAEAQRSGTFFGVPVKR